MSGKDIDSAKPAPPHRSNLLAPITQAAAIRQPDGTLKILGSHILTDEMIVAEMMRETDKSKLPIVHSGQSYPGGIMIFGQAAYTREELDDAFERIRTFGYKVADTRPEWAEYANFTPRVTAAMTLRMAMDYKIPSQGGLTRFEESGFNETINLLRTLWRNMDIIWSEDFGTPVPPIPIITRDQETAEDQQANALRIVRAWCAERCKPRTRQKRSRNFCRDAEFSKLKLQGMASIDIQKMWNHRPDVQSGLVPDVDVGAIDTAVCRWRGKYPEEFAKQ